MGASGGKSKGPPPAVKKLLGLFGSQREEDRMVGYLSFLKLGPKLLKFLPGKPTLCSPQPVPYKQPSHHKLDPTKNLVTTTWTLQRI